MKATDKDVESVCLLEWVSNRNADMLVHINFDLEDYYRIKDRRKDISE